MNPAARPPAASTPPRCDEPTEAEREQFRHAAQARDAADAAKLRAAAEVMRRRFGGLATAIAILEAKAAAIESGPAPSARLSQCPCPRCGQPTQAPGPCTRCLAGPGPDPGIYGTFADFVLAGGNPARWPVKEHS